MKLALLPKICIGIGRVWLLLDTPVFVRHAEATNACFTKGKADLRNLATFHIYFETREF